jgi:hypothetical protein
MESQCMTDAEVERDERGRVLPGSKLAIGNKGGGRLSAAKELRLLNALNDAITPDVLQDMADAVMEKVRKADPWAVDFVFDRLVGKAIQRQQTVVNEELIELMMNWRSHPTNDGGV